MNDKNIFALTLSILATFGCDARDTTYESLPESMEDGADESAGGETEMDEPEVEQTDEPEFATEVDPSAVDIDSSFAAATVYRHANTHGPAHTVWRPNSSADGNSTHYDELTKETNRFEAIHVKAGCKVTMSNGNNWQHLDRRHLSTDKVYTEVSGYAIGDFGFDRIWTECETSNDYDILFWDENDGYRFIYKSENVPDSWHRKIDRVTLNQTDHPDGIYAIATNEYGTPIASIAKSRSLPAEIANHVTAFLIREGTGGECDEPRGCFVYHDGCSGGSDYQTSMHGCAEGDMLYPGGRSYCTEDRVCVNATNGVVVW